MRVASIYEGTTAIQSNDLIGRKLGRDRGAAMAALIKDLMADLDALRATDLDTKAAKNAAVESLVLLRDVTEGLLLMQTEAPVRALAVSVPYLELCGLVIAGALMARSAGVAAQALQAGSDEASFYKAKLRTVRFYVDQVLPEAYGLARVVKTGAASVTDTDVSLI